MSKRKTARIDEPTDEALAAAVVRQAEHIARWLADPDTPPNRRAALVARLRATWKAMRPGQWDKATAQAEVINATRLPARYLAEGKWSEDRATDQALARVIGVMQDPWAPDELATRRAPSREMVRDVVRAGDPKPGRRPAGQASSHKARLALLRELGLMLPSNTSLDVVRLLRRKPKLRK